MKRTEKQREASRRNGAKSKGPVTPEGKARSAANGHLRPAPVKNLAQLPFLIEGENPEKFEALFQRYVQILNPTDPLQLNLVRRIARAEWMIEHYHAIRARVIEIQVARQRAEVEKNFTQPTPHLQAAIAIAAEAGRAALPYIDRFLTTQCRQYRTDMQELRRLRLDQVNGLIPAPTYEVAPQPQPAPEPPPQAAPEPPSTPTHENPPQSNLTPPLPAPAQQPAAASPPRRRTRLRSPYRRRRLRIR